MDNDFQYASKENLYFDKAGKAHIKNEFDPKSPQFINISGETWTSVRNGKRDSINWERFISLPKTMLDALKIVLRCKLKTNSSFYITRFRLGLEALEQIQPEKNWETWGDISINDWQEIWQLGNPDTRSLLRETYKQMAKQKLDGASLSISNELDRWKGRDDLVHLKAVRTWNSELGALTSAEMELLRQKLGRQLENETIKDWSVRISTWSMVETFKRCSQITGMGKSALHVIGEQNFLMIPGVKAQAGDEKMWPISAELAACIKSYCANPEVASLQNKHNRLIVFDCKSLREHSHIQSAVMKNCIQAYAKKLGLVSPRTNKGLNVTPNRLRHTGGTKLAEHGFPRDVIAEILEHDSYGSADAYIDAIGSDLIPAIEKSDRKLGALFSEISEIFFKGKVVDSEEIDKHSPVYIPIIEESPVLVGACGRDSIKEGKCSRHPFMGCYDNCPSFMAWKDADHTKSLHYVESEFERWDHAGGHKDRWKAKAEFERVYKAISEVIAQVEGRSS